MKVLNSYCPQKYQGSNYKPVLFEVYQKVEDACFVFCCELQEAADQYPLEDLLDQYGLVCGEYFGDGVLIDGQMRYLLEVETVSDNQKSLIKLLNFTTIVGKTVVTYSDGKYEMLGLYHGEVSDLLLNQKAIRVPIYRHRSNRDGWPTFDNTHAEAVLIFQRLMKGYSYHCAKAISLAVDLIYVDGWKAYLVGKLGNDAYQLRIGVNGVEELEKIT